MTLTQRILTEKRRFIYPLVAAIILNVAVFLAVVYPLSVKVAGGEAGAQAAASQLTSARRDYDSARATVSGKISADAELEKFYSAVLPADESDARRITYLKTEQLARKASVMIERSTFESAQERDSTLGKFTMNIVLTGQYREIRRFIYELETAPEFLIVETVALSQGGESSRGLNVDVRVATYFKAGNER